MKKYLTGIVMAALFCAAALPLQVSASNAGQEKNSIEVEAVEGQKAAVVKLTLPNGAGEKISSLQVSVNAAPNQKMDFEFDTAVTQTASVYESRSHEEEGLLNIYIAGKEPLFKEGEKTLELGKVLLPNMKADSEVTVEASGVQLVRGTKMEDLHISAQTKLGSGGPLPTNTGSPSGTAAPTNPPTITPTPTPGTSVTPTPEPTETPKPTVTPKPIAKISAPKLPKLANQKAGILVKWPKVSNASGYYVYRKTTDGKWKKIGEVKGRNKVTYTDKSVKNKNGVSYRYTIQAYSGKNTSIYNKTGKRIVRMKNPVLSKPVSASAGEVQVSWGRVQKADGYRIEYSTSRQFKNSDIVGCRPGKTVEKTIKKLKKGKTYYFRVRSYKEIGETKYKSCWSSEQKVKVKK